MVQKQNFNKQSTSMGNCVSCITEVFCPSTPNYYPSRSYRPGNRFRNYNNDSVMNNTNANIQIQSLRNSPQRKTRMRSEDAMPNQKSSSNKHSPDKSDHYYKYSLRKKLPEISQKSSKTTQNYQPMQIKPQPMIKKKATVTHPSKYADLYSKKPNKKIGQKIFVPSESQINFTETSQQIQKMEEQNIRQRSEEQQSVRKKNTFNKEQISSTNQNHFSKKSSSSNKLTKIMNLQNIIQNNSNQQQVKQNKENKQIIYIPPQSPQSQSENVVESEQSYRELQINYFYNLPPMKIDEETLKQLARAGLREGSKQLIENSQEFPQNLIGCLQVCSCKTKKIRNLSVTTATATVVGPRFALTAGHIIFDLRKNEENNLDSMIFKLRYKHCNEKQEFQREFKIKSHFYHRDELLKAYQRGSPDYDYAFLELDTNQDLESNETFKFNLGQLEINTSDEISMISYPKNSKQDFIEFTNSKGNIKCLDKKVYHLLQTSCGSSGAAYLNVVDGAYTILGIHSGVCNKPVDEPEYGTGPQFTPKIFQEFVLWVTGIDGKLDLKNKLIGNIGCRLLREALRESLRSLNLSSNEIGMEGCQQLSKTNWKNLECLNLSNNYLSQKCFEILKNVDWPSLNELILTQNRIDSRCCNQLVQAPFSNLTIINLGYNSIGNSGCARLKQSKWPKLQKIFLYWNKIDTEGCMHISSADWPNLTFIDLHQNSIDQEGCKHLTESTWPQLREIILDKNVVGDEGCQYLSEAKWNKLERLHLWRNSITEQGCEIILKRGWQNLQFLNLSENVLQKPQEVQNKFAKAYQGLDIILQ